MPDAQVVEVSHLTKQFGAVRAVDDLSFTVRPGRVTGFLGPNGAGKTTTLRCLLGLVRPTAGSVTIGGVPYHSLNRPGRVVGAALEAASFHPGRTALDHLRVYAPQVGVPDSRAREVLHLVGLDEAAKRRVGGFSLGMRQRLALATTLLGDPPVLLLDEPANGLDPEGISWLRGFMRALAAQGRTVLVSSHVLSEVQQTVDDVVIIHHGRLVRESSLAQLAAESRPRVRVTSPNGAGLVALAAARRWRVADAGVAAPAGPSAAPAPVPGAAPNPGAAPVPAAEPLSPSLGTGPTTVELVDVEPAAVGAAAFAAGLELHELSRIDAGLEALFLRLVADADTSAATGARRQGPPAGQAGVYTGPAVAAPTAPVAPPGPPPPSGTGSTTPGAVA